MKKLLLSLALCTIIGITFSYGQATSPTLNGRVKFNAESIDFGTTKLNKPVTVTYTFKNIGTTPLIIENARPSCGCTTPSYTQAPVLPGKDGIIKATYNAAIVGSVSKTVSVKFKGIDQELDLHLTGKVEK
jgi:Protein of unknown function (DUF1573)